MTIAIPANRRISKSPTPGGPCAKLENSRRTTPQGYALTAPRGNTQKADSRDTFERSELDDPALEPNHGGVGSVLGAQFGEDVPDLALHGVLTGRDLRRDLFVGIPAGDETQDTDFRRGQRVVGGMFGEPEGDLSGQGFFPSLHGSNRGE